jgi:hypothetical protein
MVTEDDEAVGIHSSGWLLPLCPTASLGVPPLRGCPSLPNPSLPASPPNRRERGAYRSFSNFSLFSRLGGVRWEKRAGLMRAQRLSQGI